MPSYISHGWKVKKPFCELLPDVDSQGDDDDDDGAENLWCLMSKGGVDERN